MQNSFYKLKETLEIGIKNDDIRDLLGQSMYYFCSGIDPTPIIAFKASIPLYIYVDSFKDIDMSFNEALHTIYSTLKNHGISQAKSINLHLYKVKNAELSLLTDENGKEFLFLFMAADGNDAFSYIYSDHDNYISPKYLCNHRYGTEPDGALYQVQKRVEYIFGHCYSSKYRKLGEYKYFGEYQNNDGDVTVPLYRRFYYYVF